MKKQIFILALLLCIGTLTYGQEYFRKDIERFRAADSTHGITSPDLLFVGSSTFTFWHDLSSYFPEHSVLNRAFGGSKIRDVLYYFEQVVKPYNPTRILFYEGDNDLAYDNFSVEDYIADLKCFIRMVEICLPAAEIFIVSTKPSPARIKYIDKYREANKRVEKLCATSPKLHFVNTWDLMFDSKGEIRKELFIEDQLHLNRNAYKEWATIIRMELSRNLKQAE